MPSRTAAMLLAFQSFSTAASQTLLRRAGAMSRGPTRRRKKRTTKKKTTSRRKSTRRASGKKTKAQIKEERLKNLAKARRALKRKRRGK